MLERRHRLTTASGFASAIRGGHRAGARTLVVHLSLSPQTGNESRVGFVVSKAVGNAVVRNQVKRRLRALARERLASLPGSAVLVVRALPPAADASYAELAGDLDRTLERVLARVSAPVPARAGAGTAASAGALR